MDVMDCIKGRRSIRRYTEQPLTEAQVRTLLEAVQWSPSWANTQVWEVVLVRDPELKEKLSQTLGKNPAVKAMVEAPVVFVMAAKLGASGYYGGQVTTAKGDWFMFDLGIATQNLCLAAHALGLGTVIVGLYDHAQADRLLGLPQGYTVTAMVPVGHPAKEGVAPKRRAVEEFSHQDRF